MRVTSLAFQLRTTDLEAAIDFYVDCLGGALAFRYEDLYAGVDIVEVIRERPWAMNEFVVRDPDGHTLYLAEPVGT